MNKEFKRGIFLNEEIVQRFELIQPLRRGERFEVYKVRDLAVPGCPVRVLKIPVVDAVLRHENETKLLWEAQVLSVMDHPNIVRHIETGIAGDVPFLLTEYIDFITLRIKKWVAQQDNVLFALYIGYQLADAVAYVGSQTITGEHGRHLTHGELALHNLLITRESHLKIIDFEGSRLCPPVESLKIEIGIGDNTDAIFQYSSQAPEAHEHMDQLVDIYSVGALLYTFITGRLFKNALEHPGRRRRLEVRKPDPKYKDNPYAQAWYGLMLIIERALDTDRSARYQDAGTLRDEIANLVGMFGLQEVEQRSAKLLEVVEQSVSSGS